ncbi:MAG: methylmalonyl Co-A mutase-associated GTPase MeaB [Synergistaceae bacterium]|jgi:LAO/AO transport system kinase|nr:methylmalonyl Co-A mutase-associated GTPase MeaB [Synergistaceae bacterium]
MDALAQRALAGDPRSIARFISLIERGDSGSRELMKQIYPKTGRAHTIGITGSPGAGKSTLVSCLIAAFRAAGKTVGVIAVDPSSPFTGGAVLGDRLRMQDHALDSGVFIRSMGSRGNLGGLSGATHEAALVLDACGFDVVLIETVGVGQSEVDVIRVSDTVCLVLVPGAGDDVQIMKAGIMEIADIFVVNKSDRDGAEKVAMDIKVMLDLIANRKWRPPVSLASARDGGGIDAIMENIAAHGKHLAETEEGRSRRLSKIKNEVEEILRRAVFARVESAWTFEQTEILGDIDSRATDPYSVASSLLDRVINANSYTDLRSEA